MFSKNQSVAILAILITPFLMLGHANGFTELPALTLVTVKPVSAELETELESVTATTTLASSNAPATITNDAGLKQLPDEMTTTVAVTIATTMTSKQNDEVQFVAEAVTAVKSLGNSASKKVAKVAEERSAATKSYFGHDKLTENVASNEGNAGNAVKSTQINYAKEQLTMPTTITHTATILTNTPTAVDAAGNVLETARLDVLVTANQATESKLHAVRKTNEPNAHQSTNVRVTSAVAGKPQEDAGSATEGSHPTIFSATTKSSRPHADFHVERQLQNGLYRIKLAEIVTDEFNGAMVEEDAKISTTTQNATKIASEYANTASPPTPPPPAASTSTGSKINIVDLYPMKMEDFNPIIRDSNAKLLRERTIFSKEDAEEHRQNLLPNEVEVDQDAEIALANRAAAAAPAAPVVVGANNAEKHSVNHLVAVAARTADKFGDIHSAPDNISDFTGKLLAEQDGVITEIEQKFRLSEFAATDVSPSSIGNTETTTTSDVKMPNSSSTTARTPIKPRPTTYSVNHKTFAGHDFIDRRVKKSFDFPMHRAASDAIALPHVDFANTKFNTDPKANVAKNGANSDDIDKTTSSFSHPEFSTTKFYNSKELYSQLLQLHKEKIRQLQAQQQLADINSKKSLRPIDVNQLLESTSTTSTTTTTTSAATTPPVTHTSAMTATNKATTIATMQVAATATTQQPNVQPKKFQKELKRAKLLLKTLSMLASPTTATTTKAPTTPPLSPQAQASTSFTAAVSKVADASATFVTAKDIQFLTPSATTPSASNTMSSSTKSPTSTTVTENMLSAEAAAASSTVVVGNVKMNAPSTSTTIATLPERRTTNPTKSSLKPIARPRILSRLQEKINSLECEIQSVPQDSHLWRGNETHELMLPIVVPQNCKVGDDCLPMLISWEGEAEIQSGDILIVEINDALLTISDKNKTNSAHTTQVYQVTRSGHEHCDVTEGILLDITPLVVDGRKLVTLYDKDLTEGVNLLIVVSERWGAQCIRLKVTTKTDNCGENADCSAKGVCFSNPTMEEYECQCCSGFAGPHCEEIDACTPSPCTNNGICVDLSQGHEGNSYQCLCPYGYTGKNCQYEADPCNPAECMNGGSCVGNSTHFRCDCTPGFAGPLCQHSLNECESSPCMHGICVDQEDGFRCFCQPGFAGELCNFEYNECESNPCQNAGECIDHIGSYECRCTKGYTGSRCQIKVDLCANKPCPAAHRCIDHGNEFSCECPGGQNGPDCNQMTRTQCNVNPCTHGGTCWSSGDSFYCACRPGYTGTMCEDEFVVETVISSSEFMVDDTSARNFNEKTFGSPVVLKSPIELHNAYFAAGVLAAAIFIVAIVVTICHCKVNQTYRKFSTRSTTFFPILGFGRRSKSQSKLNKHWLSGKGLGSGNPLRASATRGSNGHLPAANGSQYTTTGSTALQQQHQQQHLGLAGQLHERPFQRHLAMNLENDMYYTVDYSETSQQSPLIQ